MSAPRRFAERTSVPVERTKQELERLLRAHGAEGFATGWDPREDRVEFLWTGKHIRFVLPKPEGHSAARRAAAPAARQGRRAVDRWR